MDLRDAGLMPASTSMINHGITPAPEGETTVATPTITKAPAGNTSEMGYSNPAANAPGVGRTASYVGGNPSSGMGSMPDAAGALSEVQGGRAAHNFGGYFNQRTNDATRGGSQGDPFNQGGGAPGGAGEAAAEGAAAGEGAGAGIGSMAEMLGFL